MFDNITKAINDIEKGKIIIVVDDKKREDEGDLVMAAEKVTPEAINFMSTHGRGLICTPITNHTASRLDLTKMATTQDRHNTAFTVSVDARKGVTTGISAPDRSHTVRLLSSPESSRSDFDVPGHIFPLIASDKGVLTRPGHTEAAVDLARLAGCQPAGVICEIMNEDGTMARLNDLDKFRKHHKLTLCSISDLIRYRQKNECLIKKTGVVKMPTRFSQNDFDLHCYVSTIDRRENIALTYGTVEGKDDVLVRVHSECLTGDIFHSARCDCGDQLENAMQKIVKETQGILIYLRQEGRGIGLIKKIEAYNLQDQHGLDTVDANVRLGLPPDIREYSIAAQILNDLKVKSIRLMTNNPVKMSEIRELNIKINTRVPIVIPPNVQNTFYLKTKKDKLGHLL